MRKAYARQNLVPLVGARLREVRESLGVSVRDLAIRIRSSETGLRKRESKNCQITEGLLSRLAKALAVNPGYLTGEEDILVQLGPVEPTKKRVRESYGKEPLVLLIGARLKAARLSVGFTLRDLAYYAKTTEARLCIRENQSSCQVTENLLLRLAKALRVNPKYLSGEEDDPLPEDVQPEILCGNRLRECRELMGFTLDDVSYRTKISKATLSVYENQNTPVEEKVLAKLARALDVNPGFLTGTEDIAFAEASVAQEPKLWRCEVCGGKSLTPIHERCQR